MKWFHNINTLDELRTAYRRLAVLHHPDKGVIIPDKLYHLFRGKVYHLFQDELVSQKCIFY